MPSRPPASVPRARLSTIWAGTAALLLIILLLPVSPVRADIAPPEMPPGANPEPGSATTKVRMVAEIVTLDVLATPAAGKAGQARVTAEFQMRNLGNQEERLEVRFPLAGPSGAGDGFGNYPEIQDLRAWVDGQPAATRRTTSPNPHSETAPPVPWSAFDVTFPPGQDIQVMVTYTADGSGEYPYVAFEYLLETGAGWQGTIGSAEIRVRLPYEASAENVLSGVHTGFGITLPGGEIQGSEVRWEFEDLEPTQEDNFEVVLVMPAAWQKVLKERQNVQRNPADGEAWGRLGKACKEAFKLRRGIRSDPGGLALYEESRAAYDQSVKLLPEDALWHYGYADLLLSYATYGGWYFPEQDFRPQLVQAAQELKLAYELDPKNVMIHELLDEMMWSGPGIIAQENGQYTFPILTATPQLTPTYARPVTDTPAPTQTGTTTPAPVLTGTATPQPSATTVPQAAEPQPQSPTPVPVASQRGLGVCGSIVFLPALLAGFAVWKRVLLFR